MVINGLKNIDKKIGLLKLQNIILIFIELNIFVNFILVYRLN